MLHFIVLWMRRAVGSHDSIDEKMPIVGLVAEVAAISPEFVRLKLKSRRISQLRTVNGFGYALIHPVPDGSATDA